MEVTQVEESIFHRIIHSPGLSFIADDIFLFLDVKTLIKCREVCSLWKWHIVENRLLRRKILTNKDSSHSNFSARERSHNRQLLTRLLGPDILSAKYDDVDPEVEFLKLKTFVKRLDPNETQRRMHNELLPQVKVQVLHPSRSKFLVSFRPLQRTYEI